MIVGGESLFSIIGGLSSEEGPECAPTAGPVTPGGMGMGEFICGNWGVVLRCRGGKIGWKTPSLHRPFWTCNHVPHEML